MTNLKALRLTKMVINCQILDLVQLFLYAENGGFKFHQDESWLTSHFYDSRIKIPLK